jgi:hypothetical protein
MNSHEWTEAKEPHQHEIIDENGADQDDKQFGHRLFNAHSRLGAVIR